VIAIQRAAKVCHHDRIVIEPCEGITVLLGPVAQSKSISLDLHLDSDGDLRTWHDSALFSE
jgi:hypothetical protein